MFNVCGIDFRNNSGWEFRKRVTTLDGGGNSNETWYSGYTGASGIYIDFYWSDGEKLIKTVDGNYQKIDAEAIISKHCVTGFTIDVHNTYLYHATHGLFKIITLAKELNYPYGIYHVNLRGDYTA